MSILGSEVKQDLERRGLDVVQARIEKILLDANVSSTASRGVPARLRVRRLQVTGTKRYSETPGAGAAATEMKTAPIDLDWTPNDGVNGVGSEVNLRGKSSVLHLTMWALTGRSHLQADVVSWVDDVTAQFDVDGVALYVQFGVKGGVPSGKVEQEISSGRTLLGRFSGEAEFESLMGSVMLDRLRLDPISVFSDGAETHHAWPSYAAALTVHADKLDPIVGNENTLKTRILQMFVGTRWAAVDAQVATALNALRFERDQVETHRHAVIAITAKALEQGENRVAAAKAHLREFDPAEPDVDAVFRLAATASERARKARNLSLQLTVTDNAEAEARAHLRTEEVRRQAAAEDAVARRLFNGMAPTACPRCSTAVDTKRYAAEPITHECSLCSNDLNVNAEAVSRTDVEELDGDELGGDGGVDPLDALRAAVADAQEGGARLRAAHQEAEAARLVAEAGAQRGLDNIESARARLQAELELARAEGALETLQGSTPGQPPARVEDEELLVLTAASKLTRRWVKDDQDPLLASVSEAIAVLARRFGSRNITAIELKGNGNMTVHKGGAVTGYSGLTNGEKLRIKLAAVIALIEVGHSDGVGRHPGLLFVDSPAAEEIPEADLQTMLEAMTAVAEETELQIVVATTHGPMLTRVLPKDSLLVASGTDFLW